MGGGGRLAPPPYCVVPCWFYKSNEKKHITFWKDAFISFFASYYHSPVNYEMSFLLLSFTWFQICGKETHKSKILIWNDLSRRNRTFYCCFFLSCTCQIFNKGKHLFALWAFFSRWTQKTNCSSIPRKNRKLFLYSFHAPVFVLPYRHKVQEFK